MSDPHGKPAPAAPPIPYTDRDRAPVIFFDQASTVAHGKGVVALTLSAELFMTTPDGQVATEHAVAAQLAEVVAGHE